MRYINLIQAMIPEDYQEACMGDLYELDARRKQAGADQLYCFFMLFVQSILLLIVGARMRLDDLQDQLKEICRSPLARRTFQLSQYWSNLGLAFLSGLLASSELNRFRIYHSEAFCLVLVGSILTMIIVKLSFLLPFLESANHA